MSESPDTEYTPTLTRTIWLVDLHDAELSTPDAGRIAHAIEESAWLRAHDAEVAAKALEDAADVYRSGQLTGLFMGRDDYPRAWLTDSAARIREGQD